VARVRCDAGHKGTIMGLIEIVQDPNNFKWIGVPFRDRYSLSLKISQEILEKIQKIDELLDIKYHLPDHKWHLVRYYNGKDKGEFCRVWALEDNEETGMRKEPGLWIVDMLKKTDLRNTSTKEFVRKMDENNSNLEKKLEENRKDLAKDIAKELRKPLIKLIEDGGDADYKGVF